MYCSAMSGQLEEVVNFRRLVLPSWHTVNGAMEDRTPPEPRAMSMIAVANPPSAAPAWTARGKEVPNKIAEPQSWMLSND